MLCGGIVQTVISYKKKNQEYNSQTQTYGEPYTSRTIYDSVFGCVAQW